jgi:hypothetical protein
VRLARLRGNHRLANHEPIASDETNEQKTRQATENTIVRSVWLKVQHLAWPRTGDLVPMSGRDDGRIAGQRSRTG